MTSKFCGFASNLRDALPSASFIGFIGTLIEKTDAKTRAVFNHDISIYEVQRQCAGWANEATCLPVIVNFTWSK